MERLTSMRSSLALDPGTRSFPRRVRSKSSPLARGDAAAQLRAAGADDAAAPRAARPPSLVLLDAFAVTTFAALVSHLAARIALAANARGHLLSIGAGALAGYLVADLVSGIVHWFCDTFFSEDTPVIGRAFIHPFREHHRDPLAITRHGFLEVNGNNCLALLILLVPLELGAAPIGARVPLLFLQMTATAFCSFTFLTNQCHKWAHQKSVIPPVRWLQQSGILLSKSHHALHHRPPFAQAYCVTTGRMNPLLDRLQIFARIEDLVRAAGGPADPPAEAAQPLARNRAA
jgi:plasmanylethanolamine desaturase